MSKGINLQDAFLFVARRDRVPVTIYLTNGVRMTGSIDSYDSYIIILKADDGIKMIYKHAISTICPMRPMSIQDAKHVPAKS